MTFDPIAAFLVLRCVCRSCGRERQAIGQETQAGILDPVEVVPVCRCGVEDWEFLRG